MARTPSAISSSGQPCEPTWLCSRVSHGRSANARITHSSAPGSRSATPNLEVSVAVLIAPMLPPPTCGLIRSPMGETDGLPAIAASSRASSWGLSALTAMPRVRASRSSAMVLAGESSTVREAGTPAARASASSPGLATSQPTPSARSSLSTGTSEAALTAKVWVTSTPGVANASRSAAAERRTPVTSSRPTTGWSGVSSPCSTAARSARARRPAEPSSGLWERVPSRSPKVMLVSPPVVSVSAVAMAPTSPCPERAVLLLTGCIHNGSM